MSRKSMGLTAPKFRHFFPVCPVLAPIHFTPPVVKPRFPLTIDMAAYLLQGAKPLDPAIISKADNESTSVIQFQGGYRCTLFIALQAEHGVVTITPDSMAFEYVANAGYVGSDSFAYRIMNVMGQYSNCGYIKLLIRC